jgi:hypothetical protein
LLRLTASWAGAGDACWRLAIAGNGGAGWLVGAVDLHGDLLETLGLDQFNGIAI